MPHAGHFLSRATPWVFFSRLPSDSDLLSAFVSYAWREAKVPTQWYYINISRDLIVKQLKALIARDIVGLNSYYEAMNLTDPTVARALKRDGSGQHQGSIMPTQTYDNE